MSDFVLTVIPNIGILYHFCRGVAIALLNVRVVAGQSKIIENTILLHYLSTAAHDATALLVP